MDSSTLIIRADASTEMGHGHVMRCLALAQAWQDHGGECVFTMAQPPEAVERRVQSEGFTLVSLITSPGSQDDAAQVAKLARTYDPRWIVVDGYQFDTSYQRSLKQTGQKVLLIDDSGHARSYCADLVLDQNASAREESYLRREPYTKFLLGSRYAMLRCEFRQFREWQREIPPVARKILVTIGGGDPGNLTARVIRALSLNHGEGVEARVVVGGSNPHVAELQTLADKSRTSLRLEVDSDSMPELMSWADLAVASSGSTCWEMCMLGLPAILVDVADNQRPIAQELSKRGIALHIPLEQATPERIAAKVKSLADCADLRTLMSQRGRTLVDGQGVGRVVAAMKSYGLTLRPATQNDCFLLWKWANDYGVRAASFSTAPISWEEHQEWFRKKLTNTESAIFIADDEHGRPVAQIRFDRVRGCEAEVDVSVASDLRGVGYASNLIDMASQKMFLSTDLDRLCAWIRPENYASTKAFERANFHKSEATQARGYPAVLYVRERSA